MLLLSSKQAEETLEGGQEWKWQTVSIALYGRRRRWKSQEDLYVSPLLMGCKSPPQKSMQSKQGPAE